jgi:hypothetical protein
LPPARSEAAFASFVKAVWRWTAALLIAKKVTHPSILSEDGIEIFIGFYDDMLYDNAPAHLFQRV